MKPGSLATIVPRTVNAFLHRTPLYEEHKALGARIIPFAGWEMPVQYAGVVQEHNAVRRSVGVFDVSHMGQLVLSGPSAGRVIDQLVTNDVGRLNVGDALYTVCCNTSGGILDDLIVYRLEAEKFLVVCNASRHGIIEPHVSAAARGECDFQDLFGSCALLAVQGPNAARLVERFDRSITSLKYFGVKETTMAGVAVTAARTGYTGEDGFELFCRADGAAGLFREILSAGKEFAIEPAGLGARDTLRLEAALPLYGNEIDETTHPFEAGLGWVVKLKKASFVGKDALVARRDPERVRDGAVPRVRRGPHVALAAQHAVDGRGLRRLPLCLIDDAEVAPPSGHGLRRGPVEARPDPPPPRHWTSTRMARSTVHAAKA